MQVNQDNSKSLLAGGANYVQSASLYRRAGTHALSFHQHATILLTATPLPSDSPRKVGFPQIPHISTFSLIFLLAACLVARLPSLS